MNSRKKRFRNVLIVFQVVDRALSYIRSQIHKPITARDIAAQLGVSRQLLALRFRQFMRESVRETIIRARLEKVDRLLRTTDLGLDSIARQCGFRSANYLSHLFKSRRKTSPTAYRQRRASSQIAVAPHEKST